MRYKTIQNFIVVTSLCIGGASLAMPAFAHDTRQTKRTDEKQLAPLQIPVPSITEPKQAATSTAPASGSTNKTSQPVPPPSTPAPTPASTHTPSPQQQSSASAPAPQQTGQAPATAAATPQAAEPNPRSGTGPSVFGVPAVQQFRSSTNPYYSNALGPFETVALLFGALLMALLGVLFVQGGAMSAVYANIVRIIGAKAPPRVVRSRHA